jgi:ubiquinone/menaquinone biosynthesis C-methylase UbiE
MGHDIITEIATFFDKCSRDGMMASFTGEDLEKVETFLRAWDIRPGDRILEPGCGSGRLTEYLSREVGKRGEVFACDLSSEMIGQAQARNLPATVEFNVCTVMNIPRSDAYFEKVLCFNVFPHFHDPDAALAEIHRICAAGGELWINHLWSRDYINNIHRNASSDVIVSHRIPPDREMMRLIENASFTVIDLSDSERGYTLHARKD